jgi:hypothetical protein
MKNSILISINMGLLLSYVFTYYCHNKIITYTKDLSSELLIKYENIKKERMNHLGIGLILAILISLVFYYNSSELNPIEKINIIILLILLLPMIVYKVLPKSDYMLKHSQTDQDYKDWFDIYLCMKNKSIYGFFTGFTMTMMVLSLTNI